MREGSVRTRWVRLVLPGHKLLHNAVFRRADGLGTEEQMIRHLRLFCSLRQRQNRRNALGLAAFISQEAGTMGALAGKVKLGTGGVALDEFVEGSDAKWLPAAAGAPAGDKR